MDPSAHPFASATCKPANFAALPKSLLSAGTTPPLRTNTSPEPAAHSWPPQWIDRLILSAEFRTSAAMFFCTSAKSTGAFVSSARSCLPFCSRSSCARSPLLQQKSNAGPNFLRGPGCAIEWLKPSQTTFYDSSLALPKNHSSVTGLGNLPFCTTTLTRPLKFRVLSNCSWLREALQMLLPSGEIRRSCFLGLNCPYRSGYLLPRNKTSYKLKQLCSCQFSESRLIYQKTMELIST